MQITYTHAAGLDIHKKTVVACCLTPGSNGQPHKVIRTFGTMTQDILALADWLLNTGITHIAIESTGEFWKPIYQLLETSFTILVVNAQHIKSVPGRKTDVKDAEWIADLLRHGLLKASFIPPLPQRDLRDLTRQRTNLVQDRARVVNQLQKVLEWANIKLASVVTDIMGVSARAMLAALVEGEVDQAVLGDLAQGRLRAKQAELERALVGRVRNHHRFLLARHLIHIDFLDEEIARFDQEIATYIATATPAAPSTPPAERVYEGPAVGHPTATTVLSLPWAEAIELLDTAPGIGRTAAQLILAEIGTDMSRFPSAAHLASWAKVCPGNRESGGKRYSSRTGRGSRWLRPVLVQAAWAAIRVKDSHVAAVYRRLVVRLGKQKAIMAVAHRLLAAIYHMLKAHVPYREIGAVPLSEPAKQKRATRLQRQMEQLGFTVTLQPAQPAVP